MLGRGGGGIYSSVKQVAPNHKPLYPRDKMQTFIIVSISFMVEDTFWGSRVINSLRFQEPGNFIFNTINSATWSVVPSMP